MSCNHTKLKHHLYFSCCDKYYNCYYCHNQENDHIINKKNITKLKCHNCNEVQELSNKCVKCSIQFSNYYCKICSYWSNKEIIHCNKCKICYIKSENKLIHCDECNKCYNENVYKNHTCRLNKNNNECQICLEDFKKSDDKCYFLKCEHRIHVSCYNKYLNYCRTNKKLFNCGLCRQKLA